MDADSVEVVVQDLRFIEQTLGISFWGIAGLDLLSTGSFTIDYPRRKIACLDPSRPGKGRSALKPKYRFLP